MTDHYNEYHSRIRTFAELNRALFYASVQGDLKAMEELLDKGAGIDGTYTREGALQQESILGAAVKDDRKEAVELLIKRGATVNMIGPGNRTALHIAVRHGHAEIAEVLIKAGANVNDSCLGESMFDLAEKAPRNAAETINVLLAGSSREGLEKAFRSAAHNGNLKTLEVIAGKEGFDVEASDHHGNTALHMVALNADTAKDPAAAIKALLKLGANVEARNDYGETALGILVLEKDPSPPAIAALIAGGADILGRNIAGMTHYEAAVTASNPAVRPLFEEAYKKRVTDEIGKVYKGSETDMKVRPIRLKPQPK